jgi:glycosyltransferase involved in cell wall biosynthesis
LTKIALDIRFRVRSGSSIALQNLSARLIEQAPPRIRFVAVRYREQDLDPALDALDAIHVPKLPAAIELVWNELRLPGLLERAGVGLYHGMKQCAPLRLPCPSVHTVDAIKRGSVDDLPLPLGPKLYWGLHVCYIYKHSNHLLPVSDYVSGFLVDQLGVEPSRITVVHNGVNERFFEPDGGPADEPDGVLCTDRPMIICVGSVIPLKNQLAVVEALAKIADRVPNHLVLLGRADPTYAEQIDQAAQAGRIADRVHQLGFVDADGLLRYLHAAEAMVHVSRTEGFCLATGEAMACGLPLVLTDRGALREQCEDAALYIDDPDDHDALAEHLLRVLTDGDLARSMRSQGLARAAQLSWPEAARKTLAVYDRLLTTA